jgi:AcrR family transcriptional regulator
MVSKKCAPGRPRDPEVEQKILAVTLRQLAEGGYSRMSVDGVATEAGVSKPTIYRRWAHKADLVTAALRTIQIAEPPVTAESTVDQLTSILKNFRRSLLRPNGMSLVGTVLAEEHHTPELLALFRERIVEPRRRTLRSALQRARRRRELRAGADVEVAVASLVGSVYGRYLAGPDVPADWPQRVVAVVWRGIARSAREAQADSGGE